MSGSRLTSKVERTSCWMYCNGLIDDTFFLARSTIVMSLCGFSISVTIHTYIITHLHSHNLRTNNDKLAFLGNTAHWMGLLEATHSSEYAVQPRGESDTRCQCILRISTDTYDRQSKPEDEPLAICSSMIGLALSKYAPESSLPVGSVAMTMEQTYWFASDAHFREQSCKASQRSSDQCVIQAMEEELQQSHRSVCDIIASQPTVDLRGIGSGLELCCEALRPTRDGLGGEFACDLLGHLRVPDCASRWGLKSVVNEERDIVTLLTVMKVLLLAVPEDVDAVAPLLEVLVV